MSNKSGGGKSSRRSSDDLVSPRSVLDGCTTTSDNSCTAGTSTTTGAVAAYTEPSTPASPQDDEPPSQWKGAMEAWRSRTKRRLASGMSFSIRGGGSGKWRWPTAGQVNVEQHELCTLRLSFRTFSLSQLKKATATSARRTWWAGDGQLVAVKKLLPAPEKKDRVESFLSELGHAGERAPPERGQAGRRGAGGRRAPGVPVLRLGCLSRRLHGHGGAGEEEGPMPWEASYVPPEYTMHGIFNEKTDVYALGVVLLELLTGRRAIEGRTLSLVTWVRQFLSTKDDSLKMVDPALGGRYDVEQLGRVTHAAELCIHNSDPEAPNVSGTLLATVVRILRGEEETHRRLVGHQKVSNDRTANPHEIDGYDVPTPRRYQDDMGHHKALAFDF
ncbi:hypothetical protein ACQ4PT_043619 [Festuca glaucescens]